MAAVCAVPPERHLRRLAGPHDDLLGHPLHRAVARHLGGQLVGVLLAAGQRHRAERPRRAGPRRSRAVEEQRRVCRQRHRHRALGRLGRRQFRRGGHARGVVARAAAARRAAVPGAVAVARPVPHRAVPAVARPGRVAPVVAALAAVGGEPAVHPPVRVPPVGVAVVGVPRVVPREPVTVRVPARRLQARERGRGVVRPGDQPERRGPLRGAEQPGERENRQDQPATHRESPEAG